MGEVRLAGRGFAIRTLQKPYKEVLNSMASPVGWLNQLLSPTLLPALRSRWLEKLHPSCLLSSFPPFT